MKDRVAQIHAIGKKRGEQPLSGKRILITRAVEQSKELSNLLGDYGAEVICFPTIEIVPPENFQPLDKAIEKIDSYDWIIFTSVNGVKFFTQRLQQKGIASAALIRQKICAIGPKTQKELEKIGFRVHFRPSEYRAEGIAEGLKAQGIQGEKILLAVARGARRILPEALREAGALVDEVEAYQSVKPAQGRYSLAAILKKGIAVVVFTSSSTLRNFMELLPDKTAIDGVKVAIIGPVTAETAKDYGLEPDIMPAEYTIPGLVQSIVEHFTKQSRL
jgi:uroporphyrinogen III methyltransferase/synthase